MAKIIRAEFLKYQDSAQNSDKVFNIFLIEEASGMFSCVTEYGRRGNKLVRKTLCEGETRSYAEGKLRQKLLAKRNHRSTPYTRDPFGLDYSCLAKDYEFAESTDDLSSELGSKSIDIQAEVSTNNVIDFPAQKRKDKLKPEQTGILNKDQFNSLEI